MAAVISAEQAAWMVQAGPSITIASCNETGGPSVAQGLGCRVDAAREQVTVFMLESRSLDVIADLRAGRAAAVVFTHGGSLRSIQLKATSARVIPLAPGDQERIVAYTGAVALQWSMTGTPEIVAQTVLCRGPGTLLAFEFTPHVAFDQTPGPRAGTPLFSAS
jgi:hypothetical protein